MKILLTSWKYWLQAANTHYRLKVMITGCKWWAQAAKPRSQAAKTWSQAANSNHRLQIAISGLQTTVYKLQIMITGLQKMFAPFSQAKVFAANEFWSQRACCELAASLLRARSKHEKTFADPHFFYWGYHQINLI